MARRRQYIKDMRCRLGLKEDDTRRDDEIEKMSPHDRFRLLCGWNLGDPRWADTILDWAKDAGLRVSPRRDER